MNFEEKIKRNRQYNAHEVSMIEDIVFYRLFERCKRMAEHMNTEASSGTIFYFNVVDVTDLCAAQRTLLLTHLHDSVEPSMRPYITLGITQTARHSATHKGIAYIAHILREHENKRVVCFAY